MLEGSCRKREVALLQSQGVLLSGWCGRIVAAAAMVCLCCAARPASAQIYKWVDEHGVTHYAQSPPPSSAKSSILALPADPNDKSNESDEQKTWQIKDQEFRERQAKAADEKKREENKAEQIAAARRQKCLAAQSTLDTLEHRGRVYDVDAQGERVYLTDEQRVQAEQNARQNVADNCSS